MSDALSVLLLEDEPQTRDRLATVLAPSDRFVLFDAVGTVDAALATLSGGERIDVLLADLNLPDGSGIDAIAAFRRRRPETVSMVLSSLADEQTVLRAIEAGACGYLLKDGSASQVLERLEELVAGGSPMSPSIARLVLRRLQPLRPQEPEQPLSERENEVLQLLAKGFRYSEIAALLKISQHTVTTHVRRIYRKLQVNSRGEAVHEATALGLVR